MPDQFQIPQRNPPAPQFMPPNELVNAYLNRPTGYQVGGQAISQGLQGIANYKLSQQEMKAKAFDAGGPYLMNLLYGNGVAPQDAMAPVDPNLVGKNPNSKDRNASPPQPVGQSQGPQPMLHPSGVSQTIIDHVNSGGADIAGLAAQAAQYQNMGRYGREQTQNLQSQGALAMLPMQAAKTQNELAMFPLDEATKQAALAHAQGVMPDPAQGQAILSGDPNAIATAYGGHAPIEAYNQAASRNMEARKTIAGEVSKESESSQRIGQLKTMATALGGALATNKPGIFGNQLGQIYQASGGRVGSAGAAAIQNAANPLATALNTELSRRFNSGEVELLSQSLIPQPKDTPQYAQQKLANLNRLIDSMASGNEGNVRNVAAAITSGAIPKIGGTPNKGPTASYSHTATNPQTGHKIGSNNGTDWVDLTTGRQIQ